MLSGLVTACLDTFGETVTYTAAGSDGVPVVAVFETPQRAEGVPYGNYAKAFCRLSGFAATPQKGDVLTRGDTVYTLLQVDIDPIGGVTLVMEKAVQVPA